jgi:hypothetical protein
VSPAERVGGNIVPPQGETSPSLLTYQASSC